MQGRRRPGAVRGRLLLRKPQRPARRPVRQRRRRLCVRYAGFQRRDRAGPRLLERPRRRFARLQARAPAAAARAARLHRQNAAGPYRQPAADLRAPGHRIRLVLRLRRVPPQRGSCRRLQRVRRRPRLHQGEPDLDFGGGPPRGRTAAARDQRRGRYAAARRPGGPGRPGGRHRRGRAGGHRRRRARTGGGAHRPVRPQPGHQRRDGARAALRPQRPPV